jgi:transposase
VSEKTQEGVEMRSIKTWVGIDVSAKTLAAERWRETEDKDKSREFANDAAGHRELLKWIGKGARVCMEATGVYHLQLALKLAAAGVDVMVINPRVAKDFGRALANRSKTDKVDAWTLLEYVRRMDFVPWKAPSAAVQELRELGRRLSELVQNGADEKNRLHAKKTAALSVTVVNDVKAHVSQIEKRVKQIEKAAVAVVRADAGLREQFEILKEAPGVAKRSAILLLTELAVLDPTLTVKQIVGYAGLDPREHESGTSVQKPPRISKIGNARLRAILYMNALTAIRRDRGARLFYAQMVARGKKKMQAVVAVMRKLLHGIWIVLQRRVRFDSAVLFAASLAKAECSHSAVAANQPEPRHDHPKGRSEAKELRKQLDRGSAEATRSRRKRSKAA